MADREPKQGVRSLQDTLDEANRAIEGSWAEIARSRALSQSEIELSREIDRIGEGNGVSDGQGGGS
jgi:hypothetical protein